MKLVNGPFTVLFNHKLFVDFRSSAYLELLNRECHFNSLTSKVNCVAYKTYQHLCQLTFETKVKGLPDNIAGTSFVDNDSLSATHTHTNTSNHSKKTSSFLNVYTDRLFG